MVEGDSSATWADRAEPLHGLLAALWQRVVLDEVEAAEVAGTAERDAAEMEGMAELLKPLACVESRVQGVLMDLLATWLREHVVAADDGGVATWRYRGELLRGLMEAALELAKRYDGVEARVDEVMDGKPR